MKTLSRALLVSLVFAACSGGAANSDAAAGSTAGKPVAAAQPGKPVLPHAEQLLTEAVEAMGGAEKFAGLKSFYAESKLDMGTMALTGTVKTWWRGGDFYNEVEMPGAGQMRMGSLANKAWSDDPISGLRMLAGKEAEQALWSATQCLACDWKRYFTKAETTAVKDVEGKQLAEITFTSAAGDTVVLRLDTTTRLPVSQSFEQASPVGPMPVTVYFKDFRDVEGMKIPFEQVIDNSLTKASSTTTKIELNAVVDDTKFAMPGATQAVTPGALVDPAKVDPSKAAEPVKPVKDEPAKPAKKAAAG